MILSVVSSSMEFLSHFQDMTRACSRGSRWCASG